MIKGYEINQPAAAVQEIIEKKLAGKDVKLPVLNVFTNTANAVFPKVGYAWISWKAKDDAVTLVSIQAQKEADVESAYKMFFEQKKSKEKTSKSPSEKKAPKKTSKKKVEITPDNGDLSIDALGLKGKAAKDFADGSGCKTLADVAKMSIADLEGISGVGAKTREKIVEAMKAYGFELK